MCVSSVPGPHGVKRSHHLLKEGKLPEGALEFEGPCCCGLYLRHSGCATLTYILNFRILGSRSRLFKAGTRGEDTILTFVDDSSIRKSEAWYIWPLLREHIGSLKVCVDFPSSWNRVQYNGT